MKRIGLLVALVLTVICASFVGAQQTATRTRLYGNEVKTRHLEAGTVTYAKLAIGAVTLNVTNGTASAQGAVDPTLVGGTVIGCKQAGNQDQFIDNIAINGTGQVTVTLAANATATNNFVCYVLKADAQGSR